MQPSSDFIFKRCTARGSIDELFSAIKKMNGKEETVQIFDSKKVISRMHLVGAYLDAVQAFNDKVNLANDLAMEMLLFASMGRQISRAIEDIGAKPGKEFVLFASSSAAYSKVKKHIEKEEDFAPSEEEQMKVAEHYGIMQKEDLDKFVLQRMAIARIED